MQLSDYDFDLPDDLIAQHPPERRDGARMLAVDRASQSWHDAYFAGLPSMIAPTDLLVLNNTRVFPARLIGERAPSGGRVELLLVSELSEAKDDHTWVALARPARRLLPGVRVQFGEGGRLRGEVLYILPDGKRVVRFESEESFETLLHEIGRTPLPPYIKRSASSSSAQAERDEDRERYQTVFARKRGAIAAPTAGLHFTPNVLEEIRSRGAEIAEITLHVGYGTFEPVRSEDLQYHRVSAEQCEIEEEAAEKIERARKEKRRIVAVGTTTTRALESVAQNAEVIAPGIHTADLTILPGYDFRVVSALVTNFHLPRSSLLILVSAFAGANLVRAAYDHAVRKRYSFYSYGDCMFIV